MLDNREDDRRTVLETERPKKACFELYDIDSVSMFMRVLSYPYVINHPDTNTTWESTALAPHNLVLPFGMYL
jgi:hypothetical protein